MPQQRSANRREPQRASRGGGRVASVRREPSALAALVMRNPLPIAASTAFLVALSFVSANALWYQPHRHLGAFFATRDLPAGSLDADAEGGTTIRFERDVAPPPRKPDPTVRFVQEELLARGIYKGPVDGLSGAATRKAVAIFQAESGLNPTGLVDEMLLDALQSRDVTGAVPVPVKTKPVDINGIIESGSNDADTDTGVDIRKIQAGLRAFGNEAVTVDGVVGIRTRAGLREFQSMFGLEEDGEASAAVLLKMQEVGLVN